MLRALRLTLLALAVAVSTLAPTALAQAPPPTGPATTGAQHAAGLAVAYVTNTEGNLVALVGNAQAVAKAAAGGQSVGLADALAAIEPLARQQGQTQAFADAERAVLGNATAAQENATLAYAGQTVQVALGVAASALRALNSLVGVLQADADAVAHHAVFTFDPAPAAGPDALVAGTPLNDPRVETMRFPQGYANVTASIHDAGGNPVQFAPGRLPAARLVFTATDGHGVVVVPVAALDETFTVASFRVPYLWLASLAANRTAWHLTVEAPNVPDTWKLSTPYVSAPYNALSNGGDPATEMLDRTGPTTLVVLTDRTPPQLRLVTDFAADPLRPGVAHSLVVRASDDMALRSLVYRYKLQDAKGHLFGGSFGLDALGNSTFGITGALPNGTARFYYSVVATDLSYNQASINGSVDLPLPPGVPRPAPVPHPFAPLPKPVVPPTPTFVPTPQPKPEPAQGPATQEPPVVLGPGANPAPQGDSSISEPALALAVTGGLFGIPFLVLAFARL